MIFGNQDFNITIFEFRITSGIVFCNICINLFDVQIGDETEESVLMPIYLDLLNLYDEINKAPVNLKPVRTNVSDLFDSVYPLNGSRFMGKMPESCFVFIPNCTPFSEWSGLARLVNQGDALEVVIKNSMNSRKYYKNIACENIKNALSLFIEWSKEFF